MEFPNNPTRRQIEKQQAISQVITGISKQLEIEFVPESQLPSEEPGFNWETFTGYVRNV